MTARIAFCLKNARFRDMAHLPCVTRPADTMPPEPPAAQSEMVITGWDRTVSGGIEKPLLQTGQPGGGR